MAGPRPRRSGRSPPARPASGPVPAAPAPRDVVEQPGGRAPAAPGSRSRFPSCPPSSAALKRRSRSPCLAKGALSHAHLVAGHEHPGQGDVLELAQVVTGRRRRTDPAPAPSRGPPPPPLCDQTRALNAATGRTFGKKSPTYKRSASSSRSRAPPRSPSASRSGPSRPASEKGSVATRCARPAPASQQVLLGGASRHAHGKPRSSPRTVCRSP